MDYAVKNVYGNTYNKKIYVSVPGSKSLTARALLIAACANGESTLKGVQTGDDCTAFLSCLQSLGVNCRVEGDSVTVCGCGGKLAKRGAEINVASAGTAARFLTAFLAFQQGEYKINSSEQMKNRPVAPLICALERLGAQFTFEERENSFPFIIRGTAHPESEVEVDITQSSQFLTALLISSVCADTPIKIVASGSHGMNYVDMTLSMMRDFGAHADKNGDIYTVSGGYIGREYQIEPDLSGACYFYAMNKILGTDIRVAGMPQNSLQGDGKFIELLPAFDGGRIDMSGFSDQALTLAAIAPYLSRPTEICGVEHIRRQECDRIKAICENLRAMGIRCEERTDGVKIYPSQPKPAKIKTFGDHRVAMSFVITGLRADGIVIENAEVCSKTFKNFFEVLDGAIGRIWNA